MLPIHYSLIVFVQNSKLQMSSVFFILLLYYQSTRSQLMKLDSDEEREQEEKKNPASRAEKNKEFRTVGQIKDIYTKPEDINEAISKYSKTIKTVKNQYPLHKQMTIIDFSLAARGPEEDQVYTDQPFYRNNVRRGNTIIVNTQNKEVFWGRKGLMKFFDISDKSLKAIIQEDQVKIDKRYRGVHYAVFSQIENVLSCNDELPAEHKAKVHVYRLNKANGENAQISYFPPLDSWMVSSKNVSIFVREPIEIKHYQGERYGFAALMAHTWFALIADKKKNELEELKKDLTGRTLVGEYCGNQDYQHLVKYNEITIFFYALVENNSEYSCLPPPQTFRILEKHKLPIVKNYQNSLYGKYTNYKEMGQKLLELFRVVATSSIFEDEEGSVIYFVLQKPKEFCEFVSDRYLQSVPIPINWKEKDVWFNVSSLGKMKTLEYRILRKLREKLKFFTRSKKGEDNKEKNQNDQKKMQQKYGSFEREVKKLVKEEHLSKPIEYYFCAAIVAFEYCFKQRKNQRNLETLSNYYLDFISIILWSMENKKEVTPVMMNDDQLKQELRGGNWDKYGIDICAHYQEMLQRLAPRYAKIKKTVDNEQMNQEEQQGDN